MPGIRRTAAAAAAFLLLCLTWAAAESPREHVLPAGTAVVFVTDAPLEPGRREGDVVAVHLRDNLVLDGAVLAPAGTRAYLLIGSVAGQNGAHRSAISLDRFTIGAGLLPVKSVRPIVVPVAAGAQIDATTQAEVDHIGDRYSIRVPFPFRLSGDMPASAYTPTPARTASPVIMMQKRPPSPSPAPPTPAPAPTPDPAATKAPGSS